ncbi:MAG: hypothetical protein JW976_06140 [Syntrophaceae bacterium]|nr:hypothetical protein [Syntrophaceae bacterium]
MKIKKIIFIIGINIIIFIILIIGIEWLASHYTPKLGENIISHNRLNHTWNPNSKYVHVEWIHNNPDFPVPYIHYYNKQGWIKNYNVRKIKPRNVYRIFYLGDSFTEGTCPMDLSVPSLVELRLNNLIKHRDIHFEVINTGTISYSPTLCYILLRYVILDYSPDMIVLMIDLTDYFDELNYAQTLIRDEQGNPWACPPRVLRYPIFIDTRYGALMPKWHLKLQLWLAAHSYTYNLLIKLTEKRNPPSPFQKNTIESDYSQNIINGPWSWCQKEWDNTTKKNVDNILDKISRIAELCRKHNIKFMITSVPHYWQYAGNPDGTGAPNCSDRPHKEIARVAKQLNVPYLDSFNALKPYIKGTAQNKYYYAGDMHFNPRGYEVWSDIHVNFITDKKNNLLPKSSYKYLRNNQK